MKAKDFDPLAYIESAFLDRENEKKQTERPADLDLELNIGTLGDFLEHKPASADEPDGASAAGDKNPRFRKTVMSAPRPRRAKASRAGAVIDPELQECWETLPRSIEFLCSFYDDSVTANYYRGDFKETRQDLIRRLLDPELSLEETSRLLGVCPATVRRYTNRGWLHHHRTTGGQRRFRLSNIVKFVDEHGRFPEG